MHKPRLLILGPLPPPVGGVETVTKAVLESRALSGFEVSHCDTTKGRPKQTQGKFDLGNMQWAIIHFSRMWKSCWRFRPHAIYMPVTATWSGFWRDAVLALIGKLAGAVVVGHVHGAWFDRILDAKGITRVMVRLSLRLFDALLMLGTPWQRLVESSGYPGRVLVLPPTLRKEVYDTGTSFRRSYDVDQPRGLFVGQVGERKGIFELLDALGELKRAGKPTPMTVVGPPEGEGEWEAVMRRWTELDLQSLVRFAGPLEGETLYEEFRKADYLVLPSHSEGLPIVFLEAGAFGLPVIGTPVGAIDDLLKNEENALLVEPGNVSQLRTALTRIQCNARDREKLGTALRAAVAVYQPEAVCTRLADSVRAVLAREAIRQ